MKNIKRGEIYYADLSPVIGSEQDGMRPVLILQNDIGNRFRRRKHSLRMSLLTVIF